MSGPSVEVFERPEALAATVARRIAGIAAESVALHDRFDVALSGGRTPRAVYERLAEPPIRDTIEWGRVRVFFADERAVPPGDAESNHRLVMEALVSRLTEAPEVNRMDADRPDIETAANDYAGLLGEPLDLVVLGIGEDGHTASLFPGSPLLAESERRVAVVTDSP